MFKEKFQAKRSSKNFYLNIFTSLGFIEEKICLLKMKLICIITQLIFANMYLVYGQFDTKIKFFTTQQ